MPVAVYIVPPCGPIWPTSDAQPRMVQAKVLVPAMLNIEAANQLEEEEALLAAGAMDGLLDAE